MIKVHALERYTATIAAVASYVPERTVTNQELTRTLDTSHEWIYERTGIAARHIAADDEPASALGVKAVKKLFAQHPVSPTDIDLIIVPTSTPDMVFPATACIVQAAIGAVNAATFDLSAACTGYIYALNTAAAFVESGFYKNVLVVATEKYSSILDWTDRTTAVLFGDGATATLVARSSDASGIIAMDGGTDGGKHEHLYIPAGGSRSPVTKETVAAKMSTVRMKGTTVFKDAVLRFCQTIERVMAKANVTIDDIALIVPHQANVRIINAVGKDMNASQEKFYADLVNYANTSSASIGIALVDAVAQGKIKKNDLVLLTAFGAGFSWGSTLVRW